MVRVLFGTIGSAFLELARKGVKPLQKGAVEKLLLVKNCPSDQGDVGIGGGILPVGLGGGGHELLKISAPLIGDGIHRFVGEPVPFDDVVFSRGWRNFMKTQDSCLKACAGCGIIILNISCEEVPRRGLPRRAGDQWAVGFCRETRLAAARWAGSASSGRDAAPRAHERK